MLSETDALTILASIPSLGSKRVRSLVTRFGSAVNVLDDPSQISPTPEISLKLNNWKKEEILWRKNCELAYQHNVKIVPYTSPEYPQRLLELTDFPLILYMKGRWNASDQRSIAVIGTREATPYGMQMAHHFSQELAANKFTVVSGLARGIDTAAHRGALTKGRTIAVIGSGLAHVYPYENQYLADQIAEEGVLISEYPMITPPDKQNFPKRNRIVAMLTLGTFLVEAPLESGSMNTVSKALSYKKRVFALPGQAGSETFQGNHRLIKTGYASLVDNAEDIMGCFDDLFSYNGTKEGSWQNH